MWKVNMCVSVKRKIKQDAYVLKRSLLRSANFNNFFRNVNRSVASSSHSMECDFIHAAVARTTTANIFQLFIQKALEAEISLFQRHALSDCIILRQNCFQLSNDCGKMSLFNCDSCHNTCSPAANQMSFPLAPNVMSCISVIPQLSPPPSFSESCSCSSNFQNQTRSYHQEQIVGR